MDVTFCSIKIIACCILVFVRHPAKMQPITGTTNISRLKECFKAADIYLTREEWYEIYKVAGNVLP